MSYYNKKTPHNCYVRVPRSSEDWAPQQAIKPSCSSCLNNHSWLLLTSCFPWGQVQNGLATCFLHLLLLRWWRGAEKCHCRKEVHNTPLMCINQSIGQSQPAALHLMRSIFHSVFTGLTFSMIRPRQIHWFQVLRQVGFGCFKMMISAGTVGLSSVVMFCTHQLHVVVWTNIF